MSKIIKVPKDFPVRPLATKQRAKDPVTCFNCGLSWDDAIPTAYTPAPSGRCPFEAFHIMSKPKKEKPKHTPGPLSFDGFGINGNDEYKTRLVTFRKDASEEERKLYGPLFAAAPELLSASKDYLEAMERLSDCAPEMTPEFKRECEEKEDALRAAIAKAEGR